MKAGEFQSADYRTQTVTVYDRYGAPDANRVQHQTQPHQLPAGDVYGTTAHEYRHLMPENDRLASGQGRYGVLDPEDRPWEKDANEWEALFIPRQKSLCECLAK